MTELWWNQMGDWPRWFQYSLLLLVFAMSLVLGYAGSVSVLQEKVTMVLQQQNSLRNRISVATAQVHTILGFQSKAQSLTADIAQQRQRWPAGMAIAEVVKKITAIGGTARVEIQAIEPGAQSSGLQAGDWHQPWQAEGYTQFPIMIQVKGQYTQLGDFVSGLIHLPMGLIPEDFTVMALPDTLKSGQLQMSVLVSLVAWPGTTSISPKVLKNLPDFDAVKTRNPFMPSVEDKQLLRIKQPLELYPLQHLRYVGMITRDDQVWGLVLTPQQVVQTVQIGDYMGENQDKISAIAPRMLVVKSPQGQVTELPLQEVQ